MSSLGQRLGIRKKQEKLSAESAIHFGTGIDNEAPG
jgi:hypothetical protein